MNIIFLTAASICLSVLSICHGQVPKKTSTPAGEQQDAMSLLLDYSRPGPEHALLGNLSGTWNFQDKNLPFVKGQLIRKAIHEGRFFVVEITGGKLQIPVANGQMKLENYQGMEIEGYDNVKRQYFTSSINNHIGSGISNQIGKYDPQSHVFTYEWESELRPGEKVLNRKVVTVLDPDHYQETYSILESGVEKKTRDLAYTRVDKK